MRKLRLLITEECERSCPGCCNKDWDLDGLPIVDDFTGYDEILLTGGEPMLVTDKVTDLIDEIRQQTDAASIYMYTADVRCPRTLRLLLEVYLDGVTVTLHEQEDVAPFLRFAEVVEGIEEVGKSLRLNVFKGIKLEYPKGWIVKDNITWIKDCPLPEGETFGRC